MLEKEKIYLKNGGNIKLRPVDYDRACFDALIIEGKENFEIATPSQKRIKDAKKFFFKELEKLSTQDLLCILDKVECTEITCIELLGKKDSALMFELQNNRGKDLSIMEKLKSYLMYQIYVYSPKNETDANIESISNIFKLIYLLINDLKFISEDGVLIYHCNAYIRGYNYRSLEDIKGVFMASEDKVEWIKNFVNELHASFSNLKKLGKEASPYLKDMQNLGIPGFIYPFIIKGYKYFGDNHFALNRLFQILEIVIFRYKLIDSRADIESRLNGILLSFNGDLHKLRDNFREKFNYSWYWSDQRLKECLEGNMDDSRITRYLLWKYEDFIQKKGYSIGNCAIENEQIEHISPQTPPNANSIASGYEVNDTNKYDEEFINKYLHCLGNLMLISGSHNSSIGNRPFSEKLDSYNTNPLLKQQAVIKGFVDFTLGSKWDKKSISKRQDSIVNNFAVKKWDFNNIELNQVKTIY